MLHFFTMNNKTVYVLSSIGLLFTAAIWGFAFVVVKDSLDYIGPVWMVAFRFTIAAIVLAIVYYKKLHLMKKRTIVHGLVLGFYLGIAYITQTIGCDFTTAGKNAFLTTIYVFLVPLFTWPLTKKRPPVYVFLCALMSIAGIGLLALGTGDTAGINKGDLLTLLCGIFYGAHIVFTSKYNEYDDPILLTILQFAVSAFLGWLCAPFYDGALPVNAVSGSRVIVSLLYLGIFSTLIAFVLQNVGLKYLPSAWASLLLSFESVFGVLFGCMVLHEALTLRMFIGCALIFVAVVLAQILPDIIKKE